MRPYEQIAAQHGPMREHTTWPSRVTENSTDWEHDHDDVYAYSADNTVRRSRVTRTLSQLLEDDPHLDLTADDEHSVVGGPHPN